MDCYSYPENCTVPADTVDTTTPITIDKTGTSDAEDTTTKGANDGCGKPYTYTFCVYKSMIVHDVYTSRPLEQLRLPYFRRIKAMFINLLSMLFNLTMIGAVH